MLWTIMSFPLERGLYIGPFWWPMSQLPLTSSPAPRTSPAAKAGSALGGVGSPPTPGSPSGTGSSGPPSGSSAWGIGLAMAERAKRERTETVMSLYCMIAVGLIEVWSLFGLAGWNDVVKECVSKKNDFETNDCVFSCRRCLLMVECIE